MKIETADDVRSVLDYDPATGDMIWRERPVGHFKDASYQRRWNDRCAGKRAGCVSGTIAYSRINLSGNMYLVHRLVWLHVHGEWPSDQIDHIDGDRLNNRIGNLRAVTRTENARNSARSSANTSGTVGVSYDNRDKRWHAYICVGGGSRKSLGYFKTKAEACAARQAGERLLGYHPNHGRAA